MGSTNNIPVSLDDEFLARIDAIATARGASRSWVMRQAIRSGLSMVEESSTPELVFPDPDLRADVGKVAEWKGFTRSKVLLEALKIGLPAVAVRFPNKDATEAQDDAWEDVLGNLDPRAFPLAEDVRRFRREASQERSFRATVAHAFPECAAAFERVETVLRWAQGKGKPLPVVQGGTGWIPKETLEAWEVEMTREAGTEGAARSVKSASTETAEHPRTKNAPGRNGRQR